MTNRNGLILAAFLMSSAAPMAMAQTALPDAPAPATSQPETKGTQPAPSPNTTPSVGGDTAETELDNTQLITSLRLAANTEQDWASEFGALSVDSGIRVVELSELRQVDDSADPLLDDALADLQDRQDSLRVAVADHQMLSAALTTEGYTPDDVIAAVVQPGTKNEVSLIVDTPAE